MGYLNSRGIIGAEGRGLKNDNLQFCHWCFILCYKTIIYSWPLFGAAQVRITIFSRGYQRGVGAGGAELWNYVFSCSFFEKLNRVILQKYPWHHSRGRMGLVTNFFERLISTPLNFIFFLFYMKSWTEWYLFKWEDCDR